MRSMIDFSSWSSVLSTIAGLLLVTCLMMGVRLLFMQTIQKRRERENRQINERLKSLMAAYKTLGSSFTGQLEVRPTHMRDLRLHEMAQRAREQAALAITSVPASEADSDEDAVESALGSTTLTSSERQRRIRDAVEAALSDVILLGTEEQVRMAAHAAQELAEGRSIHTRELVISLRNYVREVLQLDPIPADVRIPDQGPQRPASSGAAGRRPGAGGTAQGGGAGGGRGGAGGGAAGGGGMGAMGVGMGMGVGAHQATSAPDPLADDARPG